MFINKNKNLEYVLIIISFIISCINQPLFYGVIILSLLYLFQGKIGLVKLQFLLVLRTIISPGIFFDISEIMLFQYYKWIIILGGSIYLIFYSNINKKKISYLMLIYTFFVVYLLYSSIFFSSNPLLGIFKIINYILPLIAYYTNRSYLNRNKIDLWIRNILILVSVISIPLAFSPLGYLRNQHAFQGVLNNPNMLGIVLVITYAFIIKEIYKFSIFTLISIGYIYLIYITESRTSLISILILILCYIFLNKNYARYLPIIIPSFSLLILYINKLNFFNMILRKGNDDVDILYSRMSQISSFKLAFKNSPIFGNGFGVPFNVNQFQPNDSTVVEAGNLFLAVIAFSGLLGFILFMIILIIWMIHLKKYFILVFMSTLLINMGEMVLFSSNSIGLWCSLIWGISLKEFNGEFQH